MEVQGSTLTVQSRGYKLTMMITFNTEYRQQAGQYDSGTTDYQLYSVVEMSTNHMCFL